MLLDARVIIVYELHVREGEVSDFAAELALPLAVDGHLGDFDDVSDVQAEGSLVVGVGNTGLLHAGVGWQFAL